jgi:hypothetical protein
MIASAGRGVFLFQSTFDRLGLAYSKLLSHLPTDQWDELPEDQVQKCLERYNPILADQVLEIKVVQPWQIKSTSQISKNSEICCQRPIPITHFFITTKVSPEVRRERFGL